LLYDYLFLSSNFFILLLPIIFYFLHSYSSTIQKTFSQESTEDDKKFHAHNSRFQILFKIVFVLIILFTLTQIASILIFNNELLKTNNLVKVDSGTFIFSLIQFIFLITNLFLIFFSFLYYRFKPAYRHHFVQRFFKIYSILLFTGGITGFLFYYDISIGLSLPELLTYSSKSISNNILVFNYLTYTPLLVLFFFYTYSFRLFVKKRSLRTSKLYLITYAISILMIAFLFFNFGLKYFELFGVTSTKQILFHYTTLYSGLLLVYLFSLSFYGIIFSIFIYMKKGHFIGSQFAISYTLKLANLNYYSTLALILIVIFPWAMYEFYSKF